MLQLLAVPEPKLSENSSVPTCSDTGTVSGPLLTSGESTETEPV